MPGCCCLVWRTWLLLELPMNLGPFLLLHQSELQCHHRTVLLIILVHSACWRSIPTVGLRLQWSYLTLPPHVSLSHTPPPSSSALHPFVGFFWIPDSHFSLSRHPSTQHYLLRSCAASVPSRCLYSSPPSPLLRSALHACENPRDFKVLR